MKDILIYSTIYDTINAGGEIMASVEKIIQKMKNQPNGIRMAEADKVLASSGYRLDRQKGSHRQYINESGDVITIKEENPLKAVYVKDILQRTENLNNIYVKEDSPYIYMNNKNYEAQDYMNMPYTYLVQHINDESGKYFYGKILELDGCQSTGDTLEEVYQNLNEAMEGYIETKLENNINVPLPVQSEDFSGKFVVRLPKTLHQRLAIEAEKEGVSLNQYALYKLTR